MNWYRIFGVDEFEDEFNYLAEAIDCKDLLRIIENDDYLSNTKIYLIQDELVDGVISSEKFGWWWICDICFFTKVIDEAQYCRYLICAQKIEEVSQKVNKQVREQIGPCGIDRLERLEIGSVLRRDELETEEQ